MSHLWVTIRNFLAQNSVKILDNRIEPQFQTSIKTDIHKPTISGLTVIWICVLNKHFEIAKKGSENVSFKRSFQSLHIFLVGYVFNDRSAKIWGYQFYIHVIFQVSAVYQSKQHHFYKNFNEARGQHFSTHWVFQNRLIIE